MLPIVRRHRQPLVCGSPVPATPPATPLAPDQPPAGVAVAFGAGRAETENRYNSGQFWSNSANPAPVAASVPPGQEPETPHCEPPVAPHQPGPLWSRQPGEPAEDYQLFAGWLQLPAPRPPRRAAAAALGCTPHRLSRLFTRHRWRVRAAAFENHRADAASRALDELLRSQAKSWQERAHNFRLQEWLLHEQMMAAAMSAVREFEKHPGRASLTDLVKLLELASVLGRRACGLPLDPAEAAPAPPSIRPEFEEALRKVYGSDASTPLTT
jgi:hypothetical protein